MSIQKIRKTLLAFALTVAVMQSGTALAQTPSPLCAPDSDLSQCGHLIATLNQTGVVADFYVDGVLAASQVASADVWVTAKVTHKIESRNATDPAAGGVYKWRDASKSAYFNPGQTRTVTLALRKQFLKGFLKLTCTISGVQPADNAVCQPTIDGVNVEAIPNGGSLTYTLDPGKHSVAVTVGPTGAWIVTPQTFTSTIYAGSTTRRSVRLKVSAPAPTVVPTTPPLSYYYFMSVLNFSVTTNSCKLDPNSCIIWFDFWVRHSGGGVQLGYLGVSAYRQNGSLLIFHGSYIDYRLTGDLAWHDNIDLREQGTFNLYLVICYDHSTVCDASPSAQWEALAGPIVVTTYK